MIGPAGRAAVLALDCARLLDPSVTRKAAPASATTLHEKRKYLIIPSPKERGDGHSGDVVRPVAPLRLGTARTRGYASSSPRQKDSWKTVLSSSLMLRITYGGSCPCRGKSLRNLDAGCPQNPPCPQSGWGGGPRE